MPLQPPVFFGDSALSELSDFLDSHDFDKVFILVDSNTNAHCLNPFLEEIAGLLDPEILEVEPGEASKDLEIASGLWQAMAELGATRNSLLINLGGGMVSDLGGFVASGYMRGVACIHVPTSLLAMVDAAHGGKTGLDVAGIKNLVGAWYDPLAIVVWPAFLETLPRQEWLSGWAEVVKHGLLAGGSLLSVVQQTDVPPLSIIQDAYAFKRGVVALDPREANQRKMLNLGHTLGHALESAYLNSPNPLPHGYAIVLGMVAELFISERLCQLAPEHLLNLVATTKRLYDFTPWEKPDMDAVLGYLKYDKKNKGGKVLFSLLKAPGDAVWGVHVDAESAREALVFSIHAFEWKQ